MAEEEKYLIKIVKGRKIDKVKGTVEYLSNYFKEVLDKGKEYEAGGSAVELNPTNIDALLTSLNNASANISKKTGEAAFEYSIYNVAYPNNSGKAVYRFEKV